jgi:hypothetical protein
VVLFLTLALVAGVVPIVVVTLIGGVELLPLGTVSDEVDDVTALEAALDDLLLSLQNLCKVQNFHAGRVISSSGMLSYCTSEAPRRVLPVLPSRRLHLYSTHLIVSWQKGNQNMRK